MLVTKPAILLFEVASDFDGTTWRQLVINYFRQNTREAKKNKTKQNFLSTKLPKPRNHVSSNTLRLTHENTHPTFSAPFSPLPATVRGRSGVLI